MAIINVKIKHTNYQLSCNDNQLQDVNRLLEKIKLKISEIEEKFPSASEVQLLLMTALKIQENLEQATNETASFEHINTDTPDEILAQSFDAISDYVEGLAKKLENA